MDSESVKSEDNVAGDEILACRGCLATGVKFYSLYEKGLGQVFVDFTGFSVLPSDPYPQMLCELCQHLVRKFLAFKMRCHSAMFTLQQLEFNNVKITTDALKNIDKTFIKPNLIQTEVQTFDSSNKTDVCVGTDDLLDNYDNGVNKVEEYLVIEEDVTEDIKPMHHYVTAMDFGEEFLSKIKDGEPGNDGMSSDSNGNTDADSDYSVKRKRATRSSGLKAKIIKSKERSNKLNRKPIHARKLKLNIVNEKEENKKDSNEKHQVKRDVSQDGEQELLKTIANILRKIWQTNKDSNIAEIWEMIYKQSLSVKTEGADEVECKSVKTKVNTKHQIIKFIELTKKLSKLYNMDVKFLSVEDHKKEIEDRRKSEKYANAPYRCEFCCKIYVFEDTYKRHMISHDPCSGDVECEICRYRFKNRKRYMNHFHIYHTKKIICKECGVVNRAWNFAKQHFKWHGGVTTVCEQCGKHFSDKKLYCMHVRAVHRAELATTLCLLCGDTYNGETGLRMHMDKTHRQAERCSKCGCMFRSPEALAAHVANRCKRGRSSCPMCGENFFTDELMKKHYDEQHKKEFKCEECNKSLSSLILYKRHVKRCLLPKGHEKRKRELNKEKGNRQIYNLNLMCELCGKGNFKCFATLRSHQRVHTGERPFHCIVCEKSFRELQFLKNHMKTHTDERRYKCPFCPKAFRQMGHRGAHLLTHTKERPFACTTCTKRYTGLTALKEHVNTAHLGLPPRQRGKNKQEL